MKAIILAAFLFLIAASAQAATLTFKRADALATHYNIVRIQVDPTKTPISYIRPVQDLPVVTIILDGVVGDCYLVSAIGRGGASPWSNLACLQVVEEAPKEVFDFVVTPDLVTP